MKQIKGSLKKYHKIILTVALILVAVQFIPAEKTNPPVTGELKMPANIKALFTRSCFDCHSNETVWPWYSYVAPTSWLVSYDVKEGREHLNFSEWNKIEVNKKDKIFEEIREEIMEGGMPLKKYTLLHRDANLSSEDIAEINEWILNQ